MELLNFLKQIPFPVLLVAVLILLVVTLVIAFQYAKHKGLEGIREQVYQLILKVEHMYKEVTDYCPGYEAYNNSIIQYCFLKIFLIFFANEITKVLCTTSQISYTHSCGNAVTSDFSKTFNLYSAGKRCK